MENEDGEYEPYMISYSGYGSRKCQLLVKTVWRMETPGLIDTFLYNTDQLFADRGT